MACRSAPVEYGIGKNSFKSIYNLIMNNDRPVRKTIRYKNYNYSGLGSYFITVCTDERKHVFGVIQNDLVILSDLGLMIELEWKNLAGRFSNVILGQFVIMPNHIHGIITINEILDGSKPYSLGNVIGAYKSITNRIARKSDSGKLWQRNYYEHIIRNEREYDAIADYIAANPRNWIEDEYNRK